MPARSSSTTNTRRSFPTPAAGSAVKYSAPSAFRKNCSPNGPPHSAALPNNAWSDGSAPLANSTCHAWPIPAARWRAKSGNYSNWFGSMGRKPSPSPCRKPMPPAPSAPTTSATSFANSRCSARCSHGFACKTRNLTNWPPIRCRWPTTTLSSCILRRLPMTVLQQKLDQLNLPTMSQQLEPTLTEATARNLSVAQTLEALVDRELEARSQRTVERRFKLSRLHAKPSIDSFQFNHHKSRLQLKNRILRLLDLDFIH